MRDVNIFLPSIWPLSLNDQPNLIYHKAFSKDIALVLKIPSLDKIIHMRKYQHFRRTRYNWHCIPFAQLKLLNRPSVSRWDSFIDCEFIWCLQRHSYTSERMRGMNVKSFPQSNLRHGPVENPARQVSECSSFLKAYFFTLIRDLKSLWGLYRYAYVIRTSMKSM